MSTILIAEDNMQIADVLQEYAKKEGYEVRMAADGAQALEQFERFGADLLLLDVMMPKVDGFEVCRTIRKTSAVPIIMVTARGEDFEKIMGLDIGADDYITKPFSPSELFARVRAVLRRIEREDSVQSRQLFTYDTLTIDLDQYTTQIGSTSILLTKKETELLWTLATHRNKVFSRDNLLESLWGYDYCGDTRTVDSHIRRLRAKLDEAAHPTWQIGTIWGVGYKFDVSTEKE